jgi:hypothetical protein
MATFTAVDKDKLRKAFALAHQASEDSAHFSQSSRDKFRAIARLIWQAHGEKGQTPPVGVGAALIERTGLEA